MADRIKGIVVEIGGDTTGLSKALSGVNREIGSTQSQLRDVERLLKLDPTNTQLLEQKQRLLASAISQTKEKLDTLKTAEKQVQEQFERGEVSREQYRRSSGRLPPLPRSWSGLSRRQKTAHPHWRRWEAQHRRSAIRLAECKRRLHRLPKQ